VCVAAATIAVACGHSPGTTSPTILALQPVTAVVSGTSETVLEGDLERTLYYSSSDTATSVTCTGVCTQTWMPYVRPVAPLIGPPANGGASGTLTWVRGSSGCQAQYNGHPLYTYAGDVRPNVASGDGLEGTWFVVTPDVAPASGWSPSRARSSC